MCLSLLNTYNMISQGQRARPNNTSARSLLPKTIPTVVLWYLNSKTLQIKTAILRVSTRRIERVESDRMASGRTHFRLRTDWNRGSCCRVIVRLKYWFSIELGTPFMVRE